MDGENGAKGNPVFLDFQRFKICVPLTGKNMEELRWELGLLEGCRPQFKPDLVHWHSECFEETKYSGRRKNALRLLRSALAETALVFSYRRTEKGRRISETEYCRLYLEVIKERLAEVVELEYPLNPISLNYLMAEAKKQGIRVMLSCRKKQGPYLAEELAALQKEMEEIGADLTRVAIKAECRQDLVEMIRASFLTRRRQGHKPGAMISAEDPDETGGIPWAAGSDILYRNLRLPPYRGRKSCLQNILDLIEQSLGLESEAEACRLFLAGPGGEYRSAVAGRLSEILGFEGGRMDRTPPGEPVIFQKGNTVTEIDEEIVRDPAVLESFRRWGLVILLDSRAAPAAEKDRPDLTVRIKGLTPEMAVKKILIYLNENT
ncbi:MAG: type I 3-dehydroquinate dehydratase [Peptococcaceae bacterium]|nr:type I 3-dehydroquinate dehydratase [Peptococcaceae bacterium]